MAKNTPELLRLTNEQEPFEFGFSSHLGMHESLYDIHYEWEVGVVLSGRMCRYWEDTQRTLKPGQVWLTGAWEPHGFTLEEVPCRVAVFLFRPELLSSVQLGLSERPNWLSLFTSSPSSRPQLDGLDAEILMAQLNRLNVRCAEKKGAQQVGANGTESFLVLLGLLRALLANWTGSEGDFDAESLIFIRPAVEAVLKSYVGISELEAAKLCHMSPSTFRRKFKYAMGVPFGRFALNHRLKAAAMELGGKLSIDEVALRWGFGDLSHFYKTFKKVFKQTPAQYRTRMRMAE